jgi:transposase-like protein
VSSYPAAMARLVLTARPVDLHRDGDQWKCRCPAHNDKKASLAIKVKPDGRLLLYCHAGCTEAGVGPRRVLEAWGVPWDVLFPGEPMPNGTPPTAPPPTAPEPAPTNSRAPRGEPEAVYDYTDEQGALLFQVVRFPGKDFRQRRPLQGGTWAWNLQHTRRLLYRLPDLVANPSSRVWICEGEKDADRLADLGLVATTSPMGAGKWRREYAELLAGRDVVILPDNDEPGREHARRIEESLGRTVASVRVLELPDLPEHGDVSDWLDQDPGHTADALRELAEKLDSRSHPYIGANESRETDGWVFVSARDLLAEADEEPPDLVEGLLPWGGLSVIGAKPKAGKSTLTRCLAVAVAQGRDFLGRECKRGPVIYLALEEKRREVREHLRELGMQPQDEVYVHFGATPKDGLELLAKDVERLKPVLCIIDPLFRFTKVRDVAAYAEITNALGPVLAVARRTGCHLVLVHHNTKIEREGADDLLGSTAIFGAVDTAIMLRRRQSGMRFAYSVQRYGKDMNPTVLQLRGPWVQAAGELEGFELDAIKGKVIEFLAQESPAAELAIRENVEGKTDHIAKALRQLVNDGKVGRSGTGKRGDPFMYSLIAMAPTTPAAHEGVTEVCPACGHAERDVVGGKAGVLPSWRCLQCGQLYGQLLLTDERNDEGDGNTGNEKVEQDEGVQEVQANEQGEGRADIGLCPRCGSGNAEEAGMSPTVFRPLLRCLTCGNTYLRRDQTEEAS